MKAAIIGYGKSGAAAEKLLRLKCFESIDIFDDKNEKYAGKSKSERRSEELHRSRILPVCRYCRI